MHANRLFALLGVAIAMLLGGCSTYRNSTQVQDGPGLEFKASELASFHDNQSKVIDELQKLAGLSKAPTGTEWDLVIAAGMDYADSKCEAFMHSLFRLNRDRKTVTTQIGLVGTATAGLMAAAQSAAKEVAAVAVLFGLSSSTVDNLAGSVLYDLDPSSVRTLVKSLHTGFRSNLDPGYVSRPAAVSVIRTYSMLCVPANIEAEVNLAVKKSIPNSDPGDASTGQPPQVSNADVGAANFKSRPDDNTTALRAIMFPNGVLDAAKRQALEAFIKSKNITTEVSSFMRLERFAAERAEALKALKALKTP
jgi:hypothetical protein